MITKEGFEIVHGHVEGIEDIYNKRGVYAYKSYVPYTHTSSTKVYFVSDTTGNEFGQFPTKEQALKVARKMSALSFEERKKYDQ